MPDQDETEANAPHAPDPANLEQHQPDPMLQMSAGRMGGGGLSLVAIAIVVTLAVVLFGLNGRNTESKAPAMTPPPAAAVNSGAHHG